MYMKCTSMPPYSLRIIIHNTYDNLIDLAVSTNRVLQNIRFGLHSSTARIARQRMRNTLQGDPQLRYLRKTSVGLHWNKLGKYPGTLEVNDG
jgi:hypothetical protein